MTKKELILEKSLELFSSKGFKGTSTRSIADAAEVSEGLIFKHFKSKNGLLAELLKIGASKSTPEIEKIRNSNDPKAVISSCVRLFLNIKKDDYPYWRLYYANGFEDNSKTIGLDPLLKKTVMEAFKKLGWVPEISAQEMCKEMVASDLDHARQQLLLISGGFEPSLSIE